MGTELLQEGGFAFAALLMASIVVMCFHTIREAMRDRATWVDRLLTKLEATEQEHKAHSDHLIAISAALRDTAQTMTQTLLALTKMNGGRK